MKGRHAPKLGAVGAMPPHPLSLKTKGGEGGLGGSHTRTALGRAPGFYVSTALSTGSIASLSPFQAEMGWPRVYRTHGRHPAFHELSAEDHNGRPMARRDNA